MARSIPLRTHTPPPQPTLLAAGRVGRGGSSETDGKAAAALRRWATACCLAVVAWACIAGRVPGGWGPAPAAWWTATTREGVVSGVRLRPNLGLQWYLAAEAFPPFRCVRRWARGGRHGAGTAWVCAPPRCPALHDRAEGAAPAGPTCRPSRSPGAPLHAQPPRVAPRACRPMYGFVFLAMPALLQATAAHRLGHRPQLLLACQLWLALLFSPAPTAPRLALAMVRLELHLVCVWTLPKNSRRSAPVMRRPRRLLPSSLFLPPSVLRHSHARPNPQCMSASRTSTSRVLLWAAAIGLNVAAAEVKVGWGWYKMLRRCWGWSLGGLPRETVAAAPPPPSPLPRLNPRSHPRSHPRSPQVWLGRGTGNANFLFAANLVWAGVVLAQTRLALGGAAALGVRASAIVTGLRE